MDSQFQHTEWTISRSRVTQWYLSMPDNLIGYLYYGHGRITQLSLSKFANMTYFIVRI